MTPLVTTQLAGVLTQAACLQVAAPFSPGLPGKPQHSSRNQPCLHGQTSTTDLGLKESVQLKSEVPPSKACSPGPPPSSHLVSPTPFPPHRKRITWGWGQGKNKKSIL